MNRFNMLIESILEEAKIDEALAKSSLSAGDKTIIKELNDSLPNKTKYVDFIIKNALKLPNDIKTQLEFFETNTARFDEKDINKYTVETLAEKIKELGKSKTQKKEEISKDAPIVYQTAEVVVRQIRTWEASKHFGVGTRWCITMKNTNHYWVDYTINYLQSFYFVHFLNKPETDRYYKLAIVVNNEGSLVAVYDAPDANIGPRAGREILELAGIPLDIFKSIPMEEKPVEDRLVGCGEFITIVKTGDGSFNIEVDQDALENHDDDDDRPSFALSSDFVENGRMTVKFNICEVDFGCGRRGLTTLEGSPEQVAGNFYCIGGPTEVIGSFDCRENEFTSLEGIPAKVGTFYYVSEMTNGMTISEETMKLFSFENVSAKCKAKKYIIPEGHYHYDSYAGVFKYYSRLNLGGNRWSSRVTPTPEIIKIGDGK